MCEWLFDRAMSRQAPRLLSLLLTFKGSRVLLVWHSLLNWVWLSQLHRTMVSFSPITRRKCSKIAAVIISLIIIYLFHIVIMVSGVFTASSSTLWTDRNLPAHFVNRNDASQPCGSWYLLLSDSRVCITLRSILCLAYNDPDQPGITNVTRMSEIKSS